MLSKDEIDGMSLRELRQHMYNHIITPKVGNCINDNDGDTGVVVFISEKGIYPSYLVVYEHDNTHTSTWTTIEGIKEIIPASPPLD